MSKGLYHQVLPDYLKVVRLKKGTVYGRLNQRELCDNEGVLWFHVRIAKMKIGFKKGSGESDIGIKMLGFYNSFY